ncbi:uncharacterized protein BDW47DRAFT_89412 [Aspergillus candidus]|uniref:Uncharacterized protein n=1 Tax=Aspergillus candidus TaxID=41067 RepID=A0A2I2FIZ9_ASPCN|nr:hypothetical protein BDW47DRAFT_89412 [Aspergillus candidus]PLB40611.1 hypothetical protein BDW47DRAFT_89412 [Aspergillus candidus]
MTIRHGILPVSGRHFFFFFCSTLFTSFIGSSCRFPLQELTGVRCGHFRVFMGSFPGQHLDTRLVLCVLHFSTWWSCLAFSFSSPYTGLHLIFSAFSPLLCASACWSLFRRFVPV